MQNLIYDEAPYDILYYDANLDAYRTDRFAGWPNQPTANGTPLFTYGALDYTLLTDATAVPTAGAVRAAAASPAGATGAVRSGRAPSAAPSAAPTGPRATREHDAAHRGRRRGRRHRRRGVGGRAPSADAAAAADEDE